MAWLKRLLAIVVGVILAIGALGAWAGDATWLAVALGLLAALFLLHVGRRGSARSKSPGRSGVVVVPTPQPLDGRFGGYDEFQWGHPPPSERQVAYAQRLGCPLQDGLTTHDVSRRIDETLAQNQAATSEQLREIARSHVRLTRKITRWQADQLLEALSDYSYACPQCREEICGAEDPKCPLCGVSLARVYIPVEFR